VQSAAPAVAGVPNPPAPTSVYPQYPQGQAAQVVYQQPNAVVPVQQAAGVMQGAGAATVSG
jgi:hypothetical protein